MNTVAPRPPPHAPAAPVAAELVGQAVWSWSDHACRNCLGRLVKRETPGGAPVFECGNCTTSARGAPDGICGCGVLPPPGMGLATGAKPPSAPRFRCVPNDARTVTESAAVVIRWAVQP